LSIEEFVKDQNKFLNWLRDESPSDEDLLGHIRVAERLGKHLCDNGGTIGLVGPFGSGKTSIINWIIRTVSKQDHIEVYFCKTSCWGFEDSASAIHQILKAVVEEVGKHADCFTLRSLPESYRKTFSTAGNWFRDLADLFIGSHDPVEQLKYLSELLKSLNARLVIVIEDLDRTTSTRFDRQEILALLHRLRVSDRISYILAAGQHSVSEIDFTKLCNHIEVLREFDEQQVVDLINNFRSLCISRYANSDMVIYSLVDDNPWNPGRLLQTMFDILPLSTAAAQLLRTPRALKHALRRTDLAWAVLHGEVDFDHLLAVNVIRVSAPEAFDFLLSNWDTLEEMMDNSNGLAEKSSTEQKQKRLRAEWKKIIRKAKWKARAAHRVLEFLMPKIREIFRKGSTSTITTRRQGITFERYWQRIVNEAIDENEIRDQEILRDMQEWKNKQDSSCTVISKLFDAKGYLPIWEDVVVRFLQRDSTLILKLAEQVLNKLRAEHGAKASGLEPSRVMIGVWSVSNRTVQKNEDSSKWLGQQIKATIPISLSLVNDLYYYWASQRSGITDLEGRKELRRMIHTEVQRHYNSGDVLIKVVNPDVKWCVSQLVFPPGDSEEAVPSVLELNDWSFLGPILLDALRKRPDVFAFQIGHLIAEGRAGTVTTVWVTNLDRFNTLFGVNSQEVIDLIAKEKDKTSGSDHDFLDQVVRQLQRARRVQ